MHGAGARYRPFSHEGMFEFFAEARSEAPIFYSPEIDCWVVTRRSDVVHILQDHQRFSSAPTTQPITPWSQEMLDFLKAHDFGNESVQVATDPPKHTRIRNFVQGFLTPKRFKSIEGDIRRIIREHIERIGDRESVDLVETLTYEYPARVLFVLLGEEKIDPRKLKSWADLRVKVTFGHVTQQEQMDAARELVDFWQYACDLVERRQKDPGDDYQSFLLAARGGDDSLLTVNEIRSLIFALMLAGHETTTNASGNLLLALLRTPGAWKALVDDPSLIPNAVEEGLRFGTSTVNWRRMATEDVELAGLKLPKGSKFLVSFGSANRDESVFENGEVFDIRRENARSHIAFGNGIHFCLGAPLARLELRLMLEELTAAFPDMRLAEGEPIDFIPTLSFRGPTRLPVRPHG